MTSSTDHADQPDILQPEKFNAALKAIQAGNEWGLSEALRGVKLGKDLAQSQRSDLLFRAVNAEQNALELCKTLLALGLDPGTRNPEGATALTSAASSRYSRKITELFRSLVNDGGIGGRTPLMEASIRSFRLRRTKWKRCNCQALVCTGSRRVCNR